MNIEQALRTRLLELLNERNMTMSELGKISHISSSSLYDLKKNRTKVLKISTVQQLCRGLEITMAEFFSPDYFNDYE